MAASVKEIVSRCDDVIRSFASLLCSDSVPGGLSSTESIMITVLSSFSAFGPDSCSLSIGAGGTTRLRKYFRMSADGDPGRYDDSKLTFVKSVFSRRATGLFSRDDALVLETVGLFFGGDAAAVAVVLLGESQPSNVDNLGCL